MSNPQKRSSKRFVPARWAELVIPLILVMLLLALVLTVVFVSLSVLGVFPAG
jgi:hypothetical protein